MYKLGQYLRSSKNNCIFEYMVVFIFSGKEDHTLWHYRIELCVDIPCTCNQSIVHFEGFFVLLWTICFIVHDDNLLFYWWQIELPILCVILFLEIHDSIITWHHRIKLCDKDRSITYCVNVSLFSIISHDIPHCLSLNAWSFLHRLQKGNHDWLIDWLSKLM